MIPALEQHRSELAALCRKYDVKRLDLFGSAVRGDFVPTSSDFDFLVLFERTPQGSAADRYFGLLDELRRLLRRPIDLVDVRAARNPYFIAEALQHRVMLYAA